MKLVFKNLQDTEIHILNHSIQAEAASFSLDDLIPLDDGEELSGIIIFASDDDMELNTFSVEDYLRYEISTNEDSKTCNLVLTNMPVPEPIPEPEPPTEEEILAQAKSGRATEILSARDSAIQSGVSVTTEYGNEHFSLNESDKTLLLGIYSMVKSGITAYPYHSVSADNTSNTNICEVYSDSDIAKIATYAFGWITYHESYANIMLQWLERETDVETVYAIEYGATLPKDLQDYFNMLLATANIDPKLFIDDHENSNTEPEDDSNTDTPLPEDPTNG